MALSRLVNRPWITALKPYKQLCPTYDMFFFRKSAMTSAHHFQVQHDQARSKKAEVRMMVYGSLRECKGRLRHGARPSSNNTIRSIRRSGKFGLVKQTHTAHLHLDDLYLHNSYQRNFLVLGTFYPPQNSHDI